MIVLSNTASLAFVRDAIDITLEEVTSHLETFARHGTPKALKECARAFHQLRGTSRMLELPAAALITEEMQATIRALVSGPDAALLDSLRRAVALLGRYLEYVQLKGRGLPGVLVEGINQLRHATGRAPFPDSHFFDADLTRLRAPLPGTGNSIRLAEQSRRLRHMYQVGLLGLLREDQIGGHLKLMNRALERVDALCGACRNARFWWLARGAVESLAQDQLTLTPARKRLLAGYDREFRKLVRKPYRALTEEAPQPLLRESLYLISLGSGSGVCAAQIHKVFGLQRSDEEPLLHDQSARLQVPYGGDVAAQARLIEGRLQAIKGTLDAADDGVAQGQYDRLADALLQIADYLDTVGGQQEAQQLRDSAARVAVWPADADVDSAELDVLVGQVLAAEAVLSTQQGDRLPEGEESVHFARSELDRARLAALRECRAGLALAQRALDAYVGNDWDSMHLGNLPRSFAGLDGALLFLDQPRSRAVLRHCRDYVEKELIHGSAPPGHSLLEALADALAALDFHLENLVAGGAAIGGILDVAERAAQELRGCVGVDQRAG